MKVPRNDTYIRNVIRGNFLIVPDILELFCIVKKKHPDFKELITLLVNGWEFLNDLENSEQVQILLEGMVANLGKPNTVPLKNIFLKKTNDRNLFQILCERGQPQLVKMFFNLTNTHLDGKLGNFNGSLLMDKLRDDRNCLHLICSKEVESESSLVEVFQWLFELERKKMDILIDEKTRDGENILHICCQHQKLSTVTKIIAFLVKIRSEKVIISWMKEKNSYQMNCLQVAAVYREADEFKDIVQYVLVTLKDTELTKNMLYSNDGLFKVIVEKYELVALSGTFKVLTDNLSRNDLIKWEKSLPKNFADPLIDKLLQRSYYLETVMGPLNYSSFWEQMCTLAVVVCKLRKATLFDVLKWFGAYSNLRVSYLICNRREGFERTFLHELSLFEGGKFVYEFLQWTDSSIEQDFRKQMLYWKDRDDSNFLHYLGKSQRDIPLLDILKFSQDICDIKNLLVAIDDDGKKCIEYILQYQSSPKIQEIRRWILEQFGGVFAKKLFG